MSGKKTLVLAIILGLAVLYLTQVAMPSKERAAGEKMAFSTLKASDVASIEVTQREGAPDTEKRFAVSRQASGAEESAPVSQAERATGSQESQIGSWSLDGVRGALLDSQTLRAYLSTLRTLSVEGPLSEKDQYSDLSAYGLSRPELTTIVRERAGRDTEIAFGKKNQYLSKRYVKISGRAGVFLVDDATYQALNKSSADLRSKTPFNFTIEDVRGILLTSSQGRIELSQPAVGEWKIVEPAEYRASAEDVQALLKAIQGMTVSEFIDGQFEQRNSYGFGFPRASITIQFRDGIEPQEAVFSVANSNAKNGGEQVMYAISSSSDTIFKLASDPSASLVKRVDDLRFKRVVDLPVSAMDKVVGSIEGSPDVEIKAAGTVWTVNGKESDPMFVDELLNAISDLKAVAFPEPVPADAFAKPFLSLMITKKVGDALENMTLTVGKEYTHSSGDVLRYARTSAGDVVFGIRDVEAKRIVPHEEALVQANTPSPVASGTAG